MKMKYISETVMLASRSSENTIIVNLIIVMLTYFSSRVLMYPDEATDQFQNKPALLQMLTCLELGSQQRKPIHTCKI